jgi:glycine/D-amino acid oxidase-like deaminating enzyme
MTSADAVLVTEAVRTAIGGPADPGDGRWPRAARIHPEKFVHDLEYELERIGYEIRKKG